MKTSELNGALRAVRSNTWLDSGGQQFGVGARLSIYEPLKDRSYDYVWRQYTVAELDDSTCKVVPDNPKRAARTFARGDVENLWRLQRRADNGWPPESNVGSELRREGKHE